ncbi:peptidase M28-domain containing/Zn-dependent exopeptidase superfamily protein [Klebsiella virus 2019KP1]|nr:peptidase M28-domain containing/Zn-dependent exopeptidase superfamily protein [Klebsiella virus 2019KP1]
MSRWPHGVDLKLLSQILPTHRPSWGSTKWFEPLLKQALEGGGQYVRDAHGNYFVLIGDSEQSDVAFTSHLDTVARPGSAAPDIDITNKGVVFLRNPQVADCLGADCGAGIYLMLEMIKRGVHGRYCFFVDEEVGCEGSGASAKDDTGFWTGVKAMLSFDRRGDGIITHQRYMRCCSDTFAKGLSARLGRTDPHLQKGIYTDSAEFMQIIPECTNVGVGYMHEHTPDEVLDLSILGRVLGHVLQAGTFENLPIERDPKIVEPDAWLSASALILTHLLDVPPAEDPQLLAAFRIVSQLSKQQLVSWVQENPEKAAEYIRVFSDYGFKQELIELGTRVVEDWGGYDNIVEG